MPDANQFLPRERDLYARARLHSAMRPSGSVVDPSPHGFVVDIPSLLKKYSLLAVLCTVLGAGLGFIAVAFFSPIYKLRARLEVQAVNSGVLKVPTIDDDGAQVDLQTEAQILLSTTFLRKAVQRLQLENLPPAPIQKDIFSQLRRYLKPNFDNDAPVNVSIDGLDLEGTPKPLAMALKTLDAHTVERTRILEITCESTNPEFGANFLNAVANEYIEQNQQNRLETVQLTTQWLAQQVDNSKDKMLNAENRLREFVQTSGNLFASRDDTLAESQLRELQGRLSVADADVIDKQTRYEAVQKTSPDSLPDFVDDGILRGTQNRIADLRREEALLLTTLTPQHPKIKTIESQIAQLKTALKKGTDNAVARIKSEYEEAKRNSDLLRKAYATQAAQVSAQAGKQAEYNALKRESDSARQTYNNLLLQANQASVIGSVPVNNVRLVDPSIPPQKPSKPKAPIIIGAGAMVGLGLCCGIVFLREGLNQRVSSPSITRQMFNLPQLGVIPSIKSLKTQRRLLPNFGQLPSLPQAGTGARLLTNGETDMDDPSTPLLGESFRGTLASLMRWSAAAGQPKVILVTSPEPGEGKTTITCNLALALAETGRNVLVVDADFRRPQAHRVFDLPNTWGIGDLLTEQTPINEYKTRALAVPTSAPKLQLLSNGRKPENLAKTLYSPRLRELINRLREEFDTVLIDTCPILNLADARVLSEMTDGVVLVLRSGLTAKDSVLETLQQLRADGTKVLGTVLNDWKPPKSQIKKSSYYTTLDS